MIRMEHNMLIHGDNLTAMQTMLDNGMAASVDLVYIDPPYSTGGSFTVSDGRASAVSKTRNGRIAYADTLMGDAFLLFLRARLVLLRDLLSKQGSIYLHIDCKVGHYVKILMDDVFGTANFRSDITRVKCNPKNFDRIGYGNVKDMVLFYSKTSEPIWNEPRKPYSGEELARLFPKTDKCGRKYTTVPIHAPGETENGASNMPFRGLSPPAGRHWRTDVATLEKWDAEGMIEWSSSGNPRKIIYADSREGMRVQDIWEFKDPQYAMYPTEKNADMLDLIVRTSSNPGSVVLDCFCGSGTTLAAAQRNSRMWIGIDQSEIAIKTAQEKIKTLTGKVPTVIIPAKIISSCLPDTSNQMSNIDFTYQSSNTVESNQLVLFEKGKRYRTVAKSMSRHKRVESKPLKHQNKHKTFST